MADSLEPVAQAVILCGGIGTRLGALTATTPKPLLPVAGRPFLGLLIEEIARQGVERFLLLAAFESDQIRRFAEDIPLRLNRRIVVDVCVEPDRAGTGGALHHAKGELDPVFFMFNGDSWFDVPLVSLQRTLARTPERQGVLALRVMPLPGRYGTIDLEGDRIVAFRPSGGREEPSLVNAGVYLFRRAIADSIPPKASLEQHILPKLAAAGKLSGTPGSHYFIDIGIPEDYARAQHELNGRRLKPALFLDRDGVINVDAHHVGTVDRFVWIEGAREAIRAANELGYYVFVVTNQAGIGKGYYSLEDYYGLTQHIRSELRRFGAHIDDERFCPDHPEAVLTEYRRTSDWRKPAAGMIFDLLARWPIDKSGSLMIGNKTSDLEAAHAAGVAGHLFTGGRLDDCAIPLLTGRRQPQADAIPRRRSDCVPTIERLRSEYEALRTWLCEHALPLWSSRGLDTESGGFVERLSPTGEPGQEPHRARVAGRQLYAFSRAPRFGWSGPATEIVRYGRAFLDRHHWGDDGMVLSVVDRFGKVLRAEFDLYDHAFVLFGLATVYTNDPGAGELAGRARELVGRMKARWGHPGGGFEESVPRSLPLLANPHMHMLEASLAWHEAAPHPIWRRLADEIAELCLARFLHPETGALLELFDGDWRPIAIEAQAAVEPGHQFEWAWLLVRWGRLAGRLDAIDAAQRLVEIGETHGVDDRLGLAINELDLALNVRDSRARLWPQTERIKAHLAVASLGGGDWEAAIGRAAAAAAGLRRYFEHPVPGAWWEHHGSDGRPIAEQSRASSLYHIVCAMEELRSFLASVDATAET